MGSGHKSLRLSAADVRSKFETEALSSDKGTEGASARSDKINGERVKNDDAAAARKDIAL